MNSNTHSPTPAAPQDAPVLLTPEQLARRLGISRRSLASWTRDKIVPMIKIGRICRFDPVKVHTALEQYEQEVDARRAQGLEPPKNSCQTASTFGVLQSLKSTLSASTTAQS